MKKLLTTLWKGIVSFFTTEDMILLFAYIALIFILTFGFRMLYTIWEALVV